MNDDYDNTLSSHFEFHYLSEIMIYSVILKATDFSTLGRCDVQSLPEQTLMELLVENTTESTREKFQDSEGVFLEVCGWSVVTCNENEQVVEVNFTRDHDGHYDTSFIPPHVTKFEIFAADATGTLHTEGLPQSLTELIIYHNKFSGTADLTMLPAPLRRLSLQTNEFTGSCDLTALPQGITYVSLGENKFSGSLILTKLPKTITRLFVNGNKLTGELNLNSLPCDLCEMYLSVNAFHGQFDLTNPPPNMKRLIAKNNRFSGTAIVGELNDRLEILVSGNEIEAVMDVHGEVHPYTGAKNLQDYIR